MKQLKLFESNDKIDNKPKKIHKRSKNTYLGPPSPKMGYNAYIKSEEWRQKRQYALKKAGYKCQRCKRGKKPLQVHHKHYHTLYHERWEDVEVLCLSCHRLADQNREYNSALATWAYKKYGENWQLMYDEYLQEEFEQWLDWKESQEDYW